MVPGCAGTPRRRVLDAVDARQSTQALRAYEIFRREEEPDGALLARVAALMLEDAALGDETRLRDAALSQLALAGTAGEASLQMISRKPGHDVARAKSLAILAQRGDADARRSLRGMVGHEDAEVQAAAVRVLDPHESAPALRDALASPRGVVRAAAADALRGAAPDDAVRTALSETARVDPEPRVRAAAVRALGAFGSSAVEAVRERLTDADVSVRAAAVSALVSADRTAARLALMPLLALAPSGAGIDAARFLARGTAEDARGIVDARAYLLRALEETDAALRVAAAIALLSMPGDPTLTSTLARTMEHDADANVRLLLACALVRPGGESGSSGEVRAKATLRALLEAGGMVGIQAAATLASMEDDVGARALRAHLSDPVVAIRRVAARALAREGAAPDLARVALRDADASVRIAAAGGILAAEAAR